MKVFIVYLINCTSVDISTMPSCSGTSYMIKKQHDQKDLEIKIILGQ